MSVDSLEFVETNEWLVVRSTDGPDEQASVENNLAVLDSASLSEDWERCSNSFHQNDLTAHQAIDNNDDEDSSSFSAVTAPTEGTLSWYLGEHATASTTTTCVSLTFPISTGVLDRSDILLNWLNQTQTAELIEAAAVWAASSPSSYDLAVSLKRPCSQPLSDNNVLLCQMESAMDRAPSPDSKSVSKPEHYALEPTTAHARTHYDISSYTTAQNHAHLSKSTLDREASMGLLGSFVVALISTVLALKVAPVLSAGTWPWDVCISDDFTSRHRSNKESSDWDETDSYYGDDGITDLSLEHEIFAH